MLKIKAYGLNQGLDIRASAPPSDQPRHRGNVPLSVLSAPMQSDHAPLQVRQLKADL
jgi:hypothetical protein